MSQINSHRRTKTTVVFCALVSSLLASSFSLELLGQELSRDDELRGQLNARRRCYDVTSYHLDIRIDPKTRSVSGSNRIEFDVVEDFDEMQVDLFRNLDVDKILFEDDAELEFTREANSIFIELPNELEERSSHAVTVFYSGSPIIAARPPWSGGFTWAEDPDGNPWVVVTCQGTGASLWWPHKDHPSDEPESMKLSVTVPPGLDEVSNGRLREKTVLDDGWTRYDWEISYPINNYCVTINVGKYAHFSDEHISEDGEKLTIDYYVLPGNVEKAKRQFEQTKEMMVIFEKYFGKYPFYRDGFKVIECPHPGMEHQTAVAYGNRFENGYLGRASSDVGRKFDFILIHESAHEWWGNSVTMTDKADLWIHESFGAYAESLYVEDRFGYEEALNYINGKKFNVRNRNPIIGEYDTNKNGDGDMYDKGQLALNTLRHVIADDDKWFAMLYGIQEDFKYQNVEAQSLIDYMSEKVDLELDDFFDQYFRESSIPRLELELRADGGDLNVRYRWRADVEGFAMPVRVTTEEDQFSTITPTTDWQEIEIDDLSPDQFEVDERRFYIVVERKVIED